MRELFPLGTIEEPHLPTWHTFGQMHISRQVVGTLIVGRSSA
jgi:hypothetical protein